MTSDLVTRGAVCFLKVSIFHLSTVSFSVATSTLFELCKACSSSKHVALQATVVHLCVFVMLSSSFEQTLQRSPKSAVATLF
jgi:hypothetical protein